MRWVGYTVALAVLSVVVCVVSVWCFVFDND